MAHSASTQSLASDKRARRPSEKQRQMEEERLSRTGEAVSRAAKRSASQQVTSKAKKHRKAPERSDGPVMMSRPVATKATAALPPLTQLIPRTGKIPVPPLRQSVSKIVRSYTPATPVIVESDTDTDDHSDDAIASDIESIDDRGDERDSIEDVSDGQDHRDRQSDVDEDECALDDHNDQPATQPHVVVRAAHRPNNIAVPCNPQEVSNGRPRASDYTDEAKELLAHAIHAYRSYVSSVNPYPDHADEVAWAHEAWHEACRYTGIDLAINGDCIKLVKARTTQLRGELKSKVRPLVDSMYGFGHGAAKTIITSNRELAEHLKDEHAFVYLDAPKGCTPAERKGLYRHPILQKAINVMWFANKHDEGVAFSSCFNPITMPTLALVLAAVECCIDEWGTGQRTDIAFTAVDYQDVFETHFATLQELYKHSADSWKMMDKMLQQFHDDGRFYSGAQPLKAAKKTLPRAALELAVSQYLATEPETD